MEKALDGDILVFPEDKIYEQGIEEGIGMGANNMLEVLNHLKKVGDMETLKHALEDAEFANHLLREYMSL